MVVLHNLNKDIDAKNIRYQFQLYGLKEYVSLKNPNFKLKEVLDTIKLNPEGDQPEHASTIANEIFLDGDFYQLNQEYGKTGHRLVYLKQAEQAFLKETINKDLEFLKANNMTDFQLHIMVEKKSEVAPQEVQLPEPIEGAQPPTEAEAKIAHDGPRHNLVSEGEHEIYHIGIVDYLQTWDLSKKTGKLFSKFKKKEKTS